MKRSVFVLAALLLACPVFIALVRQAAAADNAASYVVVDPLDLRQPVPNPEVGLTGKYDGKIVRFTGTPRATVDKKTKKVSFELRHDIVQKVPGTGKKPKVVVQETIVVPVAFQNGEKQLLQNLERLHRARKPVPPITVQGQGSVTGETLSITDAVVVSDGGLDVSTTNRVPRSK
ncbi:MAG TPA: hypothetical protein VH575_28290 [Gemmataceae bacterium]|jgi:hypothetical protein